MVNRFWTIILQFFTILCLVFLLIRRGASVWAITALVLQTASVVMNIADIVKNKEKREDDGTDAEAQDKDIE